jgi:hypothetical protein
MRGVMPYKKDSEDLFERIGRDTRSWLAQAQELKMSSDTILPGLKEAFAIPPAFPGAQEKRFAFFHSYMLLVGLAFENLIKGILIGRNPALVDREKIESGILGRKGHGIAEGAREIIALTSDECRLLQRIEEYLFWAGRYPLPLTSGIYHNSEVQELRSGRTDDPATIKALFEKLVDVLERELKARDTSASA